MSKRLLSGILWQMSHHSPSATLAQTCHWSTRSAFRTVVSLERVTNTCFSNARPEPTYPTQVVEPFYPFAALQQRA